MPYSIQPNSSRCPVGKPHAVIKSLDGSLVGCHPTKQAASKQMAALYAQEQQKSEETQMPNDMTQRPPRDELVRAFDGGFELRDDGADEQPRMVGHFARFGEWTEVDSIFEGHFMERIAPGAFKKTIGENGKHMKVLLEHGQDPQLGKKPIGRIEQLREDSEGAYYEVRLLDAPYVRDNVLPGLREGLYGSSFRFAVQRQDINRNPRRSTYNPEGIQERTLKELAVREFGPCAFPAYKGATAGIRSLTDQYLLRQLSPLRERLDAEDLSCLAEMMQLGTRYIEEQDAPGDEVNVPVMERILSDLASLVPYEVAEDEGLEPEDEGMASDGRSKPDAAREAPRDAPSTADAAHSGTSDTERREWPHVSHEEWKELEKTWNRRI